MVCKEHWLSTFTSSNSDVKNVITSCNHIKCNKISTESGHGNSLFPLKLTAVPSPVWSRHDTRQASYHLQSPADLNEANIYLQAS